MARHDTETTHVHNTTETIYKQIMDLSNAAERYTGTGRFANTAVALSNIISEQPIGPHVTINNILLPETRGSLDAEDYVELRSGAKRNMGTVPPQNMNETVKGIQRLGDRVCDVDKVPSDATWASMFQSMIHTPSHSTSPDASYRFLNKYLAGAPLTKAEIEALKKNTLLPCTLFTGGPNGSIVPTYSNGALCTGYIQLLDDALQKFKSYFSTLIGKTIKIGPYAVTPRRIVYDRSRLIKSCFNPVINEAAQIALECDAIQPVAPEPDGSNPDAKPEEPKPDDFKSGTGFIRFNNLFPIKSEIGFSGGYTYDDIAYLVMSYTIRDRYLDGCKDLGALLFVMCCFFISEGFKIQAK